MMKSFSLKLFFLFVGWSIYVFENRVTFEDESYLNQILSSLMMMIVAFWFSFFAEEFPKGNLLYHSIRIQCNTIESREKNFEK